MDFCECFFFLFLGMLSIDSLRILLLFSIDGSSSFRVSNLVAFFFKVLFWREWLIFLRSNLSVFFFFFFFFLIFFSLINFFFISTLALTILWSLPKSTLAMISQFPTVFRSEDSRKSIWCLVTPPGASHVQYLFAAFTKNGLVTTRLFSSAKPRSLSPLISVACSKGPCAFHVSIYIS